MYVEIEKRESVCENGRQKIKKKEKEREIHTFFSAAGISMAYPFTKVNVCAFARDVPFDEPYPGRFGMIMFFFII